MGHGRGCLRRAGRVPPGAARASHRCTGLAEAHTRRSSRSTTSASPAATASSAPRSSARCSPSSTAASRSAASRGCGATPAGGSFGWRAVVQEARFLSLLSCQVRGAVGRVAERGGAGGGGSPPVGVHRAKAAANVLVWPLRREAQRFRRECVSPIGEKPRMIESLPENTIIYSESWTVI